MADPDLSRYYRIIKKPLMTEKSTFFQDEQNKYYFLVAPTANKVQIREAVERLFDVKVVAVNTMLRQGKLKRVGAHTGRGSDWKRAIVTLREGDRIEFV